MTTAACADLGILHAQNALQQQSREEGCRSWVVQEDSEALAASELVLRAWRSESCGQEPSTVSHAWEEVDSEAVVFGPRNELGTAREIVQEPGQVLVLQVRHAHQAGYRLRIILLQGFSILVEKS